MEHHPGPFWVTHVWMWELDYKESWALKNWCFQTVVLEKTLDSLLDHKEIKPVNPKGNLPWIFIGKTNAKAQILRPPDAKNWLIGKRPWCWERLKAEEGDDRGWDGWMASVTWWTWVWASSGSWWCHPTISSSVIPFFCLQSFPASGSFLISLLFTSGGQNTGASASASVFPMNIQDWISFRMDWLDLIPVQGTLKSLLQHHSAKASILWCSAFFMVQFSHPYMTTGKTIALTIWIFVVKAISLLSNTLSRLVIDFLPRSKCLLISCSQHLQWFWSPRNYIV